MAHPEPSLPTCQVWKEAQGAMSYGDREAGINTPGAHPPVITPQEQKREL